MRRGRTRGAGAWLWLLVLQAYPLLPACAQDTPQTPMATPSTPVVHSSPSTAGAITGSASFGFGMTNATQSQQTYSGTLVLSRDSKGTDGGTGDQISNASLFANYTDSKQAGSASVITQMYEAKAQHNIYITDHVFLFPTADLYHNYSLGLYFQQSYGGGAGWRRTSGTSAFEVSGDLRYIGEQFNGPAPSLNLIGLRMSENYAFSFLKGADGKPKATFSETVDVIPALNDARALQTRGTLALALFMTKKLSLVIQEFNDFVRNAPSPAQQYFQTLQVQLRYSWR